MNRKTILAAVVGAFMALPAMAQQGDVPPGWEPADPNIGRWNLLAFECGSDCTQTLAYDIENQRPLLVHWGAKAPEDGIQFAVENAMFSLQAPEMLVIGKSLNNEEMDNDHVCYADILQITDAGIMDTMDGISRQRFAKACDDLTWAEITKRYESDYPIPEPLPVLAEVDIRNFCVNFTKLAEMAYALRQTAGDRDLHIFRMDRMDVGHNYDPNTIKAARNLMDMAFSHEPDTHSEIIKLASYNSCYMSLSRGAGMR